MTASTDRIAWVLFGILLAMCVVVGAAFFVEERPYEDVTRETGSGAVVERVHRGHGVAHPEHPQMLHGGDGEARQEDVFWLGLAFGVLQMAFITLCLCLGVRRSSGVGPLGLPLAFVGAFAMGVVIAVFLTYRTFLAETDHAIVLGFPVPTAWVVYGLWGYPFLFAAIFIVFFKSWYLPEGSLKRFSEIAKRSER